MPVLVGLVGHGLGLAILPIAFIEQSRHPIWSRPLTLRSTLADPDRRKPAAAPRGGCFLTTSRAGSRAAPELAHRWRVSAGLVLGTQGVETVRVLGRRYG